MSSDAVGRGASGSFEGLLPRSYLKALRADFLPLLPPGDARFGLSHRLAHERRHSSRNPRLIIGGLDEVGHA